MDIGETRMYDSLKVKIVGPSREIVDLSLKNFKGKTLFFPLSITGSGQGKMRKTV
jgi:hypothetical protein